MFLYMPDASVASFVPRPKQPQYRLLPVSHEILGVIDTGYGNETTLWQETFSTCDDVFALPVQSDVC